MNALAHRATAALLAELHTTPKPGLVDLETAGAHRDLSVERLRNSALALEDVFAKVAAAACGAAPSTALREELGALGRWGERVMLRASGGTNTHRGALWALGLLVAGEASLPARDRSARAIAARAGTLAKLPDRFAPRAGSHGALVARRFGAGGAMAEAAAGFPSVVDLAYPLLVRGTAPADVLLALMGTIEDTCVLHRGGAAALHAQRRGARAAWSAGGSTTPAGRAALRALDAAFIAGNISAGGCADLLAAGLFLAGPA